MTDKTIINIIFNTCGFIILLPSVLPVISPHCENRTGQRKHKFVMYSAMLHLFVLSCLISAEAYQIGIPSSDIGTALSMVSLFPAVISAALLTAAILCDENGVIRIPKGRKIPIAEISCAVIPPLISLYLAFLFPGYEFMPLSWSVSLHMFFGLSVLDRERKAAEKELRLNRDYSLVKMIQMQPHFIFNTLSAIRSLCHTDPARAEKSIENLSGYIRSNIDALSSEELITFDEEFGHIRQYIDLELADPARQFRFDYELDVRNFLLPALTVQPIVENAVKHGALTHTDGSGIVSLSTEAFGDYIRITVTDNGLRNSGLTEIENRKKGIGIENTKDRLYTLCNGSLSVTTTGEGTKAIILIPKMEA